MTVEVAAVGAMMSADDDSAEISPLLIPSISDMEIFCW
jgi:hypothetical protein